MVAVSEIVDRFATPELPIYAGGAPVLNVRMMLSLVTNMVVFTSLSTAMIALFLVLVLRRALGVFVPLTISILSVVGTVGAMGAIGIPAMPISEIVPSFLLAVGVGASVHLIVIFLQRYEMGASREDAIAGALGHSGLPIIMTSLTTAGGLASFAAADLLPIAVFGIVSPLGLIVCLLISITLAPALLAVVPLRPQSATHPPSENATLELIAPDHLTTRVLTRMGAFATRRPGTILGGCAALARDRHRRHASARGQLRFARLVPRRPARQGRVLQARRRLRRRDGPRDADPDRRAERPPRPRRPAKRSIARSARSSGSKSR